MPPTSNPFDPFGESADPRRYVPLDTSERILADAAAKIRDGFSPILLAGPSGVGKTLLLRVLGERERLRGQRVAYSPFFNLPPEECARWLLHLLGIHASKRGAESVLLAELRSPGGLPTLVLVDEIQAAPEASVRKLAELAQAGRPTLAVVVAGSWGRPLEERLAALAPAATLRLPESFPEAEVSALCGAILAAPELSPALRQSLSPRARRKIVRAASGLPRRLKAELEFQEQRLGMVPTRRPRPVEELCLDTWQPRAPAAAPPSEQQAPELALWTPPVEAVTAPLALAPPLLKAGRARGIRSAARSALRGVASAGARAEAALAATHRVALSAVALCVLALFLHSGLGSGTREIAPVSSTPVAVQVQVNARPWARIRIDGVDVGPTPLSRPLPPGVYRIDAEFPDGRSLQRRVEIGPEQRFVALY